MTGWCGRRAMSSKVPLDWQVAFFAEEIFIFGYFSRLTFQIININYKKR